MKFMWVVEAATRVPVELMERVDGTVAVLAVRGREVAVAPPMFVALRSATRTASLPLVDRAVGGAATVTPTVVKISASVQAGAGLARPPPRLVCRSPEQEVRRDPVVLEIAAEPQVRPGRSPKAAQAAQERSTMVVEVALVESGPVEAAAVRSHSPKAEPGAAAPGSG